VNVLLFGATGMIAQGVLRECLLDDRVKSVIAVVRAPLSFTHPKLRELIHRDFTDFSPLSGECEAVDACFFCLGISSAGKGEEEYRRITYEYTLAAARALPTNPSLTFIYVSGEGTDNTQRGRSMWARVKGRTENELLAMPFHAYMFRPGYIQPPARRDLEDPGVPMAVCRDVLALSTAAAAGAEVCDDHREPGPRDACGGEPRRHRRAHPAQPGDQPCGGRGALSPVLRPRHSL
jgi:uncharacterized protein YbjT (DUF2867 family)